MRRVRSKDTTPERKVRSLLHRMGFRFRLHRNDLPGCPDIVLPRYATVIFVHGCFWHRHPGCKRATTPASHKDYWVPKFERTVERDRKNQEKLCGSGWNVIVVWECELRELDVLADRLMQVFSAVQYEMNLSPVQTAAESKGKYQTGTSEKKH